MSGNHDLKAHWGAVLALALGITIIVATELLPASLLTLMASDLRISTALAGQSITVTSLTAMVASLFIPSATRRFDRRYVMMAFTLLLVVSSLMVAISGSVLVMLAGRVLLGISLGGFWSLAPAMAMKLVPGPRVPKALAIIFGGVSLAMVAAAPLGSYLGDLMGWRHVFLATAVVGGLTLLWQLMVLPSVSLSGQSHIHTLVELLRRPQIQLGMLCILLIFAGHFTNFTYVRVFLENVSGISGAAVSVVLLAFGAANVAGTFASGYLVGLNLRRVLGLMPLLLGLAAMGLSLAGHNQTQVMLLCALWGAAFGCVPVAWTTWVTRAMADEAESGGALQVAATQLSISTGAGLGGVLTGTLGVGQTYMVSGMVLLAAGALALWKGQFLVRGRAELPGKSAGKKEY